MAETIKTERRDSSSARVPSVPPGKAIVYTRYAEEKSVVMNPEDFHRLVELEAALTDIADDRPIFSELASKAHALEDTPGEPVEHPAKIKALLRL